VRLSGPDSTERGERLPSGGEVSKKKEDPRSPQANRTADKNVPLLPSGPSERAEPPGEEWKVTGGKKVS